jgi:hypothetical protein
VVVDVLTRNYLRPGLRQAREWLARAPEKWDRMKQSFVATPFGPTCKANYSEGWTRWR